MGQVARVVVRRRHRQGAPLGHGPELLDKLRDVPDLRRERARALGVLGVVAQEVAVLLEGRAAPGGVDDDVIQVLVLELVYEVAGEPLELLLAARVHAQGAAAALALGGDDLAALGGQDPHRGGVDVGEKDPLHAALYEADPAALLADGGGDLRYLLLLGEHGHEGLHRLETLGEPVHDAGLAEPVANAEALVQLQGRGGEAQPVRVGEELEDHLPERLVLGGALVAALYLPAGGLDELVVLDARGARGDACHAPQAQIPVAHHLVVHWFFGEALVHQVDAPARGVHLLPEKNVGRAGGETEAAMDAVVDEVLLWRVVVVEGREDVAAGLGGTSYADGLLDGAARGEGVVGEIFGTAGPHGLGRPRVLRRGGPAGAALGGVGSVVRVPALARVRRVVAVIH